MKRAICTLLLAALLGSASGALAADGPMLTAEDLAELQPAYEAFLDELEDLIVEKGLLADDQREAWRMYQLGDFFQNGGYGMIAAMYTPDLLVYARDVDSLVSLSCQTGAGLLELQTMRGYTPLDSALPGLLLEVSLSDAEGMPVPCRFRFTATQGSFLAWDALGARGGRHLAHQRRQAGVLVQSAADLRRAGAAARHHPGDPRRQRRRGARCRNADAYALWHGLARRGRRAEIGV